MIIIILNNCSIYLILNLEVGIIKSEHCYLRITHKLL